MFIEIVIVIITNNECFKNLISISNTASEMVRLLFVLMHTRLKKIEVKIIHTIEIKLENGIKASDLNITNLFKPLKGKICNCLLSRVNVYIQLIYSFKL